MLNGANNDVRGGTQSISRAFTVLNEVAWCQAGSTLKDLASRTGLPLSTLHRILQCLVSEAAVWQDRKSRKYFLGTRLSELKLAMPLRENRESFHTPTCQR